MIIAIVDFDVAPADRDEALAVLREDALLARDLPGNLSYRAFTNVGSNSHVGIMHEWETLEDFTAYTESDTFARIGRKLRPRMTSAPVSRRIRAEVFEEVRA